MRKIISYSLDGGDSFIQNTEYNKIEEVPVSEDHDTHIRYVTLFHENNYFQSRAHYVNYCMKIFKDRFGDEFSKSKELLRFLYFIYDSGETKKKKFEERNWHLPHFYFSFHLRKIKNIKKLRELIDEVNRSTKNIDVDETSGVFSVLRGSHTIWIISKQGESLESLFSMSNYDIPDEAKELIMDKPGIYKFYNSSKELIYIGRADNLFNRVYSSMKERLARYVSFIVCENKADAYVLEPYLVTTLDPKLNVEFSTDDFPSFTIPLPKESKLFKIEEINDTATNNA